MEGMESASNVTPDTSAGEGQSSEGQESSEQGNAAGAPKGSKPKAQADSGDDLEEIALGTVKGRVPKALAKAIKDYERGVQGKFQETAQLRRQAQELENLAKSNPREFLKRSGVDPVEFSEMTLAEQLEALSMTPEQKRLKEYEEKVKGYEEKVKGYEEREKQEKDRLEQLELTKKERELHDSLQSEMLEAFQSSKLPKDPYLMQQMAAVMLSAEKRGESLKPAEAALRVKTRFTTSVRQILESSDVQTIRDMVGERVVKLLREEDVRRVTEGSAPTPKSSARPGKPVTASPQPPKKPMTEKEYRQWVQTLKG